MVDELNPARQLASRERFARDPDDTLRYRIMTDGGQTPDGDEEGDGDAPEIDEETLVELAATTSFTIDGLRELDPEAVEKMAETFLGDGDPIREKLEEAVDILEEKVDKLEGDGGSPAGNIAFQSSGGESALVESPGEVDYNNLSATERLRVAELERELNETGSLPYEMALELHELRERAKGGGTHRLRSTINSLRHEGQEAEGRETDEENLPVSVQMAREGERRRGE